MQISELLFGAVFRFSEFDSNLYRIIPPYDTFPCVAFAESLSDGARFHIFADYSVFVVDSLQLSMF